MWFGELSSAIGYDIAHEVLEYLDQMGILDWGENGGLSRLETIAVHLYSRQRVGPGDVFSLVNSYLRYGQVSWGSAEMVRGLIEDFVQGVAKLAPFEGALVRRTSLPSEVKRMAAKGHVFQDKGVLSFSTDPNSFKGVDMLAVSSVSGRDISSFSFFPEEQEVVFLPNKEFKIESVSNKGSGMLLILSEVN